MFYILSPFFLVVCCMVLVFMHVFNMYMYKEEEKEIGREGGREGRKKKEREKEQLTVGVPELVCTWHVYKWVATNSPTQSQKRGSSRSVP